MKRSAVTFAAALGAVAVLAPPAQAEERTCRGSIGAVTVDDLRVPQGATCSLNGTSVKGTVKVERAATLTATGVRVVGNVQAEGAARVVVRAGSRVGGSVQLKQGGGGQVLDSVVQGDVQLDQNGAALVADRNVVGGSIQVVGNRGGVRIALNRVDGNLQCKENAPRPTGGGNVVQGSKEDQCARL